jgi:hypothetical protein
MPRHLTNTQELEKISWEEYLNMKIKTFFCIFVLLSVAFAVSSYAQEVQVPIDAEGKLEFIDSEIERDLGMFTDYENFREARLFQISDTSFVLEISYQPQKSLLKVRLPLSAKEAFEFRRKVTERIKLKKPRAVLNQEGRTKLLAGTLALSLGYYGWAVPVTFDVDDGKSFAAIYMLTSGAGFFIPFLGTRDIPVTDAAATLGLYGGTRGIVHGIFLYGLAKGEDATGRGMVGFGMLGSFSEGIAFFSLADRSNMSAGMAEVICIGGDFGIGWGLGAAHLANFFDEDEERSIAGSILLGSATGLVAGKMLAERQQYTRGDAYVLRGAGILGAYIPLAVVDMAEPEDDRTYTAAAMVGSVIGLGLGHRLVRGKDFTTGQGTLVNLGELAGGLVGLGVAYLVSPDDDDDNSSLFLTSSALGATGGFWLLYRSFARTAQTHARNPSWNIHLSPEGLLAYAMGKRSSRSSDLTISLAKLEFRF